MPSLRLEIGGGATKTFALRDGDLVGRVKGVAIVLAHESVSRKHAAIHVDGARVEVEDLGSSNGTFVNDRQIVRQSLAHGDRVRFGRVVLAFDAGEESLPRATAEPASAALEGVELRAEFGADDWADEGAGAREDEEDELRFPGAPAAEAIPGPRIELRARPAESAPRPTAEATGTVESGGGRRVLQYRKVEARGGLLGQDLAQWGLLSRAAALLAVAALSLGLFYLAKWLGGGLAG
jgi:predicted component of type VI protein secretion system